MQVPGTPVTLSVFVAPLLAVPVWPEVMTAVVEALPAKLQMVVSLTVKVMVLSAGAAVADAGRVLQGCADGRRGGRASSERSGRARTEIATVSPHRRDSTFGRSHTTGPELRSKRAASLGPRPAICFSLAGNRRAPECSGALLREAGREPYGETMMLLSGVDVKFNVVSNAW